MGMVFEYYFDILKFFGGSVCHQLPERTFHGAFGPMPVCYRCTGIYLALFVSFAYYLVFKKRGNGNKPPGLVSISLISLCFLPMAYDGLSTFMGLRETTNMIRYFTGAIFTAGIPVLIILIYNFKIDGENNQPIIKSPLEHIFLVLAACALYFVFTIAHPAVSLIIATITIISLFILFFTVSRFLLTVLLKQRNNYFISVTAALAAITVLSFAGSLFR